jgi:Uma2 family endonuclease
MEHRYIIEIAKNRSPQPIGGFMTVATANTAEVDTQPLLLNVTNTTLTVTSKQFDRLCIDNPDLRLELSANRELIVMAPTGGESGKRNGDLSGQVWYWNRQTDRGEVFDSSTGYDLTALNGGKPSPDVSWIQKSRLEGVNIVGLIPVVPDFVVELLSATDSLSTTKTKMERYQQVGVRLGLLINPKNQQVEVYRAGQEPEILELPLSIDCSEVMPGFSLDMSRIW